MLIDSVQISNFRIYKGRSEVCFKPNGDKNITLISANNGFGKTTFLTALIWAFYGKHIVSVEPKYRRDITNSGGYSNFLKTLVNKDYSVESGEAVSVSISLSCINNPSVPFNSAQIVRTINTESWVDCLEILIDGQPSELTTNVGNDVFINDYILPREIAKFFFFDAEKIVSLAEAKTIPELRQLGIAYSEVLGISKFEELITTLNNTLLKISKEGPDRELPLKYEFIDKAKLRIEQEIDESVGKISASESEVQKLEDFLNEIRESLYREGAKTSKDKLQEIEKHLVSSKIELQENSDKIREYLEYIPFMVAGPLYNGFVQTVSDSNPATFDLGELFKIVDDIKSAIIEKIRSKSLLTKEVERLIEGFEIENGNYSGGSSVLVQIDKEERDRILATQHYVEKHVKMQIAGLYAKDSELRQRIFASNSELKRSEINELNPIVKQLNASRSETVLQISRHQEIIREEVEKLGGLRTNLNTTLRVHSQLFKKLSGNAKDYKKIEIITTMIRKVKALIEELHVRKKQSLEFALLSGINRLMHKDGYVSKVELNTSNGIFNVTLFDENGLMIEKNDLSKGEQQLYATALLSALVEESGIQFPVFIDSPLQKFDKSHTRNVICHFYPKISKQVVLFPLIEKELTKDEFGIMEPFVNSVYRVNNIKSASKIEEISKDQLFLN
jgi:DNA sulfur modification protein DndD